MGYFTFWCAPLFCPILSAMSSHKVGGGGGERDRELLVDKFLRVNISNKAAGCSINLSSLKPTLLKVSGETGVTRWDETGCSMDVWNLFQTWVKPVILCSVYRA